MFSSVPDVERNAAMYDDAVFLPRRKTKESNARSAAAAQLSEGGGGSAFFIVNVRRRLGYEGRKRYMNCLFILDGKTWRGENGMKMY